MVAASRLAIFFYTTLCIHTIINTTGPVAACIFKFGTSPDSLAPQKGGTPWNHGFNGDDWAGVDAGGRPWPCLTGLRQSPINVPPATILEDAGSTIPDELRTTFRYPTLISNGSDMEVINNGHVIQVEWLSPFNASVQIAVPARPTNQTTITSVLNMNRFTPASRVQAVPLQFHFHTLSEHPFNGRHFPLELHIVHLVTGLPACAAAGGCFSVLGVVFELTDGPDNPLLADIWAALPAREGQINYLPAGAKIDLEQLLPTPRARDYVTYEGSLTTPPCSEGLLWHVMLRPQKISLAQWAKFQRAVGFKECSPKNATAPAPPAAVSTGNRRLLATAEDKPAAAARRVLAAAAAGNPDDFTCKVAAYGYNYRYPQKQNGRTVKLARASDDGGLLSISISI